MYESNLLMTLIRVVNNAVLVLLAIVPLYFSCADPQIGYTFCSQYYHKHWQYILHQFCNINNLSNTFASTMNRPQYQ